MIPLYYLLYFFFYFYLSFYLNFNHLLIYNKFVLNKEVHFFNIFNIIILKCFGNTLNNPAGNLHITSLKGGLRHYFLLGRIFLMGNLGTAIQSYSKSAISGNNLLTEFGAGFRLFGLEIQATQSSWKQPIDAPAPNAYNIKFGYSFKL